MIDKNLAVEFGEKLRELRLQKGIGLRELAIRAGISKTYLSYIEKGVHGLLQLPRLLPSLRHWERNLSFCLDGLVYLHHNTMLGRNSIKNLWLVKQIQLKIPT